MKFTFNGVPVEVNANGIHLKMPSGLVTIEVIGDWMEVRARDVGGNFKIEHRETFVEIVNQNKYN